MKRVRLTLRFRDVEIRPLYELVTDAPYLERVQTINWNVSDPPTTFLFRMRGDPERFERDLEAAPGEFAFDLLPGSNAEWYWFLQGTVSADARALFENFTRGSLLTVPPIEWNDDGSSTFTVIGPDADVQRAVDGVPEGVTVTVETVGGDRVEPGGVRERLSSRQREAAETATELGYYAVPREATTEDVARAMDCATATAAEHLRKAEAKAMESLFDS